MILLFCQTISVFFQHCFSTSFLFCPKISWVSKIENCLNHQFFFWTNRTNWLPCWQNWQELFFSKLVKNDCSQIQHSITIGLLESQPQEIFQMPRKSILTVNGCPKCRNYSLLRTSSSDAAQRNVMTCLYQ